MGAAQRPPHAQVDVWHVAEWDTARERGGYEGAEIAVRVPRLAWPCTSRVGLVWLGWLQIPYEQSLGGRHWEAHTNPAFACFREFTEFAI